MDVCPAILLSDISSKKGDHYRIFAEENEAIEYYKDAERIVIEASKDQSTEAFDDALPQPKTSSGSARSAKGAPTSTKSSLKGSKSSNISIGVVNLFL